MSAAKPFKNQPVLLLRAPRLAPLRVPRRVCALAQDVIGFDRCQHHPTKDLDIFCEVCRVAICADCKLYGNHSMGVMASHNYRKLPDAFSGIRKRLAEVRAVRISLARHPCP